MGSFALLGMLYLKGLVVGHLMIGELICHDGRKAFRKNFVVNIYLQANDQAVNGNEMKKIEKCEFPVIWYKVLHAWKN